MLTTYFENLTSEVSQLLTSDYYRNNKFVLALSGGKDSMCLLHVLHTIALNKFIPFRVVHVVHNIRSKTESDMDVLFIRNQCSKLKVEVNFFEAEQGEIYAWKSQAGGLEAASRYFRYRVLLNNLADEEYLLTAQHADDLIENTLKSIFEGNLNRPFSSQLKILRPFLKIQSIPNKQTINQIVEEKKIAFIQDSTNANNNIERNNIRNNIIPCIRQHYPEFSKHIIQLTQELMTIKTTIQQFAPPCPWEPCKFLGKGVYSALIEKLGTISNYFALEYTRWAMNTSRCTTETSTDLLSSRIPTKFIFRVLNLLKNTNQVLEGYEFVFFCVGKWIYMLPLLAIYPKKGYFRTIHNGEQWSTHRGVILKLTWTNSQNNSDTTMYVIRSMNVVGISRFRIVKEKLQCLFLVLENNGIVVAIIYPDFETQKWDCQPLNNSVELQYTLEQFYE